MHTTTFATIPSQRFWLLVAIVALIALVAGFQGRGASAQGPPDHVPDHVQDLLEQTGQGETVRVIVELPDQASQNPVAQQARGQGAQVIHQYNNFPMLALEVNENALRGLLRSPRVSGIIEDVPEPPTLDGSIPHINADQVHNFGWDGNGVTVAILDTGIDVDHPFFEGRIVEEACFSTTGDEPLCPNGEEEQTGAGASDIGHDACLDGTTNICTHGPHVAGIAAGGWAEGVSGSPQAGTAPAANIISIQVFSRFNDDDECGGDPGDAPCVKAKVGDQIAGLDLVYDLRDDYEIAAANMSIGNTQDNTSNCDGDNRKDPIDKLRDENIATILTAGNEGHGEGVGRPGCISTGITVGATNNSDTVFYNRGPLVDLLAPGRFIVSAEDAGTFGSKSGTSMAAPHVAGAWAVMRQAYPDMDVDEVFAVFQETGVDVTYDSGPGQDPADWDNEVTTPRIDLLAALQEGAAPPEIDVDEDAITVDEGQVAENTGTFADNAPANGAAGLNASIGEVTDEGDGEWSWSFQTIDGPRDSQEVTITVTDNTGQEAEATFELTVENVAPAVEIDLERTETTIEEGESLSIFADFSDAGIEDTHEATITCYDVNGFVDEVTAGFSDIETDEETPIRTGTVSGVCDYGDTSQSADDPGGTFTVTVTVTDRDGDSGSDSFELTVENVDPTVDIDTTEATNINGVPTFIGQLGDELDFSARVTDPGSDDLFLEWDWDDGSTATADYFLIDEDNPDPFPSPNVDPRDIIDEQSHIFDGACLFDVVLTAEDDDGGVGSDRVDVVIGGDADEARSGGYWLHQYRGNGQTDFDQATLDCYLAIVNHMSAVFDDVDQAHQILHVAGNRGDMEQILERQLLAAWLNFANGAFALDTLVDTTGDGVGDTTFEDAIAAAEAVALDDDATRADLEEQKDILENINLMHES